MITKRDIARWALLVCGVYAFIQIPFLFLRGRGLANLWTQLQKRNPAVFRDNTTQRRASDSTHDQSDNWDTGKD